MANPSVTNIIKTIDQYTYSWKKNDQIPFNWLLVAKMTLLILIPLVAL
jgi:hypothetical protein